MKIFILIIILAMYGAARLVIDLIRVFRYLIKEEIKAWERRGGDRLRQTTIYINVDTTQDIYYVDIEYTGKIKIIGQGTERRILLTDEFNDAYLDAVSRMEGGEWISEIRNLSQESKTTGPCEDCKVGTAEQRCKVCELPDQKG